MSFGRCVLGNLTLLITMRNKVIEQLKLLINETYLMVEEMSSLEQKSNSELLNMLVALVQERTLQQS